MKLWRLRVVFFDNVITDKEGVYCLLVLGELACEFEFAIEAQLIGCNECADQKSIVCSS